MLLGHCLPMRCTRHLTLAVIQTICDAMNRALFPVDCDCVWSTNVSPSLNVNSLASNPSQLPIPLPKWCVNSDTEVRIRSKHKRNRNTKTEWFMATRCFSGANAICHLSNAMRQTWYKSRFYSNKWDGIWCQTLRWQNLITFTHSATDLWCESKLVWKQSNGAHSQVIFVVVHWSMSYKPFKNHLWVFGQYSNNCPFSIAISLTTSAQTTLGNAVVLVLTWWSNRPIGHC